MVVILAGGGGVITDLTGTSWLFNEVISLDAVPEYSPPPPDDLNDVISDDVISEEILNDDVISSPSTNSRWAVNFIFTYAEVSPLGYRIFKRYRQQMAATLLCFSDNEVPYAVFDNGTTEWMPNFGRQITFTGGTDATNPDLISWLQENATQIS